MCSRWPLVLPASQTNNCNNNIALREFRKALGLDNVHLWRFIHCFLGMVAPHLPPGSLFVCFFVFFCVVLCAFVRIHSYKQPESMKKPNHFDGLSHLYDSIQSQLPKWLMACDVTECCIYPRCECNERSSECQCLLLANYDLVDN